MFLKERIIKLSDRKAYHNALGLGFTEVDCLYIKTFQTEYLSSLVSYGLSVDSRRSLCSFLCELQCFPTSQGS